MRISPIFASFLLLAGCVTTGTETNQAATQFYRAAGDQDQLKISGNMTTPYKVDELNGTFTWKRKITVSVNDEIVIDEFLPNPKEASGELSGQYHGKPVSSVCAAVSTNAQNPVDQTVDCLILIDNQRAATLRF